MPLQLTAKYLFLIISLPKEGYNVPNASFWKIAAPILVLSLFVAGLAGFVLGVKVTTPDKQPIAAVLGPTLPSSTTTTTVPTTTTTRPTTTTTVAATTTRVNPGSVPPISGPGEDDPEYVAALRPSGDTGTNGCPLDQNRLCIRSGASYVTWMLSTKSGDTRFTSILAEPQTAVDGSKAKGVEVATKPAAGLVAVASKPIANGGYVAYIEKVNSDGSLTVRSYVDGKFYHNTDRVGTFSAFINFGKL